MAGADWQPPAELTDFLAGAPPQADVRAIAQHGWISLDAVTDDMPAIGEMPHERRHHGLQ